LNLHDLVREVFATPAPVSVKASNAKSPVAVTWRTLSMLMVLYPASLSMKTLAPESAMPGAASRNATCRGAGKRMLYEYLR